MKNYFVDAEFEELSGDGQYQINLISLGLACEDGRTLYLENQDFVWSESTDAWLFENVKPLLLGPDAEPFNVVNGLPAHHWQRPTQMKQVLLDFIAEGEDDPVWWAYIAACDFLSIVSLFDGLRDLPRSWPKHCRELKHLLAEHGFRQIEQVVAIEGSAHRAVDDAIHNMRVYNKLVHLK